MTAGFSLFIASDAFGAELAGHPVVVVSVGHLGDDDAAARDVAPLLALGPSMVALPRVPYLQMQTGNDDHYSWGQRNYWNGLLLDDLGPDTVEVMLNRLDDVPSEHCGFGMITMGGAVSDCDHDATAFSGRHAKWWLTTEALWHDDTTDEEHFAWGRRSLARLQDTAATVNYVNDLGEADEPDAPHLATVYGRNATPGFWSSNGSGTRPTSFTTTRTSSRSPHHPRSR